VSEYWGLVPQCQCHYIIAQCL